MKNKKEVIVYLPFKKETKIKPSKNIMCIDVNSENVTIGIFSQEGEILYFKQIYLPLNKIDSNYLGLQRSLQSKLYNNYHLVYFSHPILGFA